MAVRKMVAVNAHASNPLTEGPADAIYCGGAGNLVCRFDDDDADVTIPVVAGGYVLGRIGWVRVTGTTATGLFACYEG
jgi:hypothetical protein